MERFWSGQYTNSQGYFYPGTTSNQRERGRQAQSVITKGWIDNLPSTGRPRFTLDDLPNEKVQVKRLSQSMRSFLSEHYGRAERSRPGGGGRVNFVVTEFIWRLIPEKNECGLTWSQMFPEAPQQGNSSAADAMVVDNAPVEEEEQQPVVQQEEDEEMQDIGEPPVDEDDAAPVAPIVVRVPQPTISPVMFAFWVRLMWHFYQHWMARQVPRPVPLLGYNAEPEEEEPAVVEEEAVEQDEEPAAPQESALEARQYTPTFRFGVQGRSIDVEVKLLALHCMLFGHTGSGKTFATKALIETVIAATTITNTIIIDAKGDFKDMIQESTSDQVYNELVDANVITLGSDLGLQATVDPWAIIKKLKRLLTECGAGIENENKRRDIVNACTHEFTRVMLHTVMTFDKSHNPIATDMSMPTSTQYRGAYGVPKEDKKMCGQVLTDTMHHCISKCVKAGCAMTHDDPAQFVPSSWEWFKLELRQLNTSLVGGFEGGPGRREIPSDVWEPDGMATYEGDIPWIINKISLFMKTSPYEVACSPSTYVAPKALLDAELLLSQPARNRHGMPMKSKITIVDVAPFFSGNGDEKIGQFIVEHVLSIISSNQNQTGGTQERPTTMVVLDEIDRMLGEASKNGKGASVQHSCLHKVSDMLKRGRSQGLCVLFATQHPSAISTELVKDPKGLRLFGKISTNDSDMERVMANLGGGADNKKKAFAKRKIGDLDDYEFWAVDQSDLKHTDGYKVSAPALKRRHEPDDKWGCLYRGDGNKLEGYYTTVAGKRFKVRPGETVDVPGEAPVVGVPLVGLADPQAAN